MMVKTPAIPLSYTAFSSSSRIVHWLTRTQGKVAVLLRGALRPKSPFLGEYELFGTSELLYYPWRNGTLHTGKECAMLHARTAFRRDWRAMQAASYLSLLFDAATPAEAPQPGLFGFFEELLDLASEHGRHPQFLCWAELKFCARFGHAPNLGGCVLCRSEKALSFCAGQGGTVCAACARPARLATLPCPPDVLAILRAWQKAAHPRPAIQIRLSGPQGEALQAIAGTFVAHQFNIHPRHRGAIRTAA